MAGDPTDDAVNVHVVTEIPVAVADQEIERAIGVRHTIARAYVNRLHKRNPEATPAEIVTLLEKHYLAAITVAGGVITAGSIAANVGLNLVPGGGAGKTAGAAAAKGAVKGASKLAARKAAKKAAQNVGRQAAAQILPAGTRQLQFEITGLFALALAEIHDMRLDREQALALINGIANGRVEQTTIAEMASDVARTVESPENLAGKIAQGHQSEDWTHWATTLATVLPGGAAKTFVDTMTTGELDTMRSGMNSTHQSAVEYGVGTAVGGASRFVFGREVVASSRVAFPEPPAEFPTRLALTTTEDDPGEEPSRAVRALEDAARSTGTWVVATADRASRAFRRVDLDGDGIPDEPRALTAAKSLRDAARARLRQAAEISDRDRNPKAD